MSDNGNQKTFVNQYRRKILLSGAAWFSMCFTATASLASGDGGGRDESDTTGGSSTSLPVKKYSQSQFRQLTTNELVFLADRDGDKFIVEIAGFSTNMTSWIVIAASYDRTSMRRLLKDMAKLKTEKARKARLQAEIKRVTKLEGLLKSSIKRLKAKGDKASKEALEEERLRLRDAREHNYGLRTWLKYPHEGARS